MFEHLRRIREVKKAETHTESEPVAVVPRTDEGVDHGRRHFLRGMAATAAVAAMPTVLKSETAEAGVLDTEKALKQREAALDSAIGSLQWAVKSPDVRAALDGKGDYLLTRTMKPLQFPINPRLLEGTKYDMSETRKRYCVQMAYQSIGNGKNNVHLISEKSGTFKKMDEAGYGNGVYWGATDRFLTAQHVVDISQNKEDSSQGRDLAILNLREAKGRPEQVLQDDTSLSNEDIHGAFVSIEGIDPDKTSGEGGYKSYPGVAMRLGRGFVERVFVHSSKDHRDRMARSFMIALPPGEAQGATAVDKPATGMSGAPVFMNRGGRRVLAGIMHMVTSIPDPETKRNIDIGFFHGIEEVRDQMNLYMRSGA